MPTIFLLLLVVAFLAWLLRPAGNRPVDPGDEVEEPDLEDLDTAQREVRDLGVHQDPEEGFEGDDWGPGTGNPPRR